jgi:hypothetical protein
VGMLGSQRGWVGHPIPSCAGEQREQSSLSLLEHPCELPPPRLAALVGPLQGAPLPEGTHQPAGPLVKCD